MAGRWSHRPWPGSGGGHSGLVATVSDLREGNRTVGSHSAESLWTSLSSHLLGKTSIHTVFYSAPCVDTCHVPHTQAPSQCLQPETAKTLIFQGSRQKLGRGSKLELLMKSGGRVPPRKELGVQWAFALGPVGKSGPLSICH